MYILADYSKSMARRKINLYRKVFLKIEKEDVLLYEFWNVLLLFKSLKMSAVKIP